MQILVIDDDPRFRQMLRTWLVKQGHDVHATDGGEETFQLLRRIQYDVITLDLRMPKANGLSIIHEIRQISPKTSIIVLSAEASARVAIESIKAGAEACLEKPLDFSVLGAQLDRLAAVTRNATPALSLSLGHSCSQRR